MNLIQHQPRNRKRRSNVSAISTSAALIPSVSGNPLAPYMETVQIACENCGGDGRDPGALDQDFFNEPACPVCKGSKTQTVSRNYLSEAFAIAANPDSDRPVDRKHVVAIVRYARELVSASMKMPELTGVA